MKCPSCESVGELEAFLKAAGSMDEEAVEEAMPAAVTVPVGASVASMEATPKVGERRGPAIGGADTGTRISGSATKLNLPPGLRCTLTVINGPDRGRKLAIDKARIVVGRNSGDFPLTDEEVSTQHCAFEITGVSCTVKDLDSRNGTFVDGEKIDRATLSTVGEVQVGGTTLLFTMTIDDGVTAG